MFFQKKQLQAIRTAKPEREQPAAAPTKRRKIWLALYSGKTFKLASLVEYLCQI